MSENWFNQSEVEVALRALLKERILVLDGAMGTHDPGAQARRGRLPRRALRAITRASSRATAICWCSRGPTSSARIHDAYLDAGADIIETNTFNATSIAQADYGARAARSTSIERGGGAASRRAARRGAPTSARADGARFVAGAIGPTNRTLSLSPKVNDPSFRAVTFDQVRAAYAEQVRGLLDGGVDVLLAETIFDTLNLKACLFAIDEVFEERKARAAGDDVGDDHRQERAARCRVRPSMRSGSSVAHARPFSVGINCALGAAEMRPYLARARAHRRLLRELLPERRAAERVRRVRRAAGA